MTAFAYRQGDLSDFKSRPRETVWHLASKERKP